MTNETKAQSPVTLPKEVAAAIEVLRKQGFTNSKIVVRALDGESYAYYKSSTETLRSNFNVNNIGDLSSALINGYHITKTPEEMVREFYKRANVNIAEKQEEYSYGVRYGIDKTLNLLGITIPGVNAPAKEDE